MLTTIFFFSWAERWVLLVSSRCLTGMNPTLLLQCPRASVENMRLPGHRQGWVFKEGGTCFLVPPSRGFFSAVCLVYVRQRQDKASLCSLPLGLRLRLSWKRLYLPSVLGKEKREKKKELISV